MKLLRHGIFAAMLFAPLLAQSQSLRALPEGQLPEDSRYAKPVTLHDYHPFRKVGSKEEWAERQAHIQRRVQAGAGLWPEPTKTPLKTVIHGEVIMGDYTVEKVFFESFPGHFVTGNLYRPAGHSLTLAENNGKRPGILCPHGHWSNARFYDAGEMAAKRLISIGAERFMNAARNHIQARCVQLARMGCVVFHYDMLGNSDSIQFLEHRRGPREHLIGPKRGNWGLVSPQAAARLQTNFGIQTWNSVRALDFLTSLSEVDSTRLMITGASGGGTQTQMLAAIDDRIDASFPCVMPSTAMQGGCTCENTYFLRIGQGNIDIAAAVAPRPQGMTAADDWTIELKTKGAPDLFALYEMVGAKGNFQAHYDVHFKHNYNHVSRTHMYGFVNRHFKIGLPTPVLERDFQLLGKEDLSVWNAQHPAPSGKQVGDEHEKALLRWWTEDVERQLSDPAKTREILQGAVPVLIGRRLPAAEDVEFELVAKEERENGLLAMSGVVRNKRFGEVTPAQFLHPKNWNGSVAIWVFPGGKSGLYAGGKLLADAKKLLEAGTAVMSPDLWRQGEFLKAGEDESENPRTQYPGDTSKPGSRWRLSSVYYYGYNHSTFARRVHDILNCVTFVRHHPKWEVENVALIGPKGAGHWAAAARAVSGEAIDRAAVVTDGFRFAELESDWDADFLPGGAKYGDVGGWLALSAPHSLWVQDGDAKLKKSLQTAYAKHPKNLSLGDAALINYVLGSER